MSQAKTWHMPDGTKSTNKPRDGAIYSQFDSKGNGITWQWDGLKEQWFNVSSGKPTPANTTTFFMYPGTGLNPIDLDNLDWEGGPIHVEEAKPKKCDCGSVHIGSPRHSTWCQVYDPAQ